MVVVDLGCLNMLTGGCWDDDWTLTTDRLDDDEAGMGGGGGLFFKSFDRGIGGFVWLNAAEHSAIVIASFGSRGVDVVDDDDDDDDEDETWLFILDDWVLDVFDKGLNAFRLEVDLLLLLLLLLLDDEEEEDDEDEEEDDDDEDDEDDDLLLLTVLFPLLFKALYKNSWNLNKNLIFKGPLKTKIRFLTDF